MHDIKNSISFPQLARSAGTFDDDAAAAAAVVEAIVSDVTWLPFDTPCLKKKQINHKQCTRIQN